MPLSITDARVEAGGEGLYGEGPVEQERVEVILLSEP